jgi:hypothetical protein
LFQYGVSADVYSLTIIVFELFSGINPFPGHIGQIFQAKMSNKKPAIPSDFPLILIELMLNGWSKEQKERPSIHEFKSALNKMLTSEGKDQSLSLQDNNYPKEKEEQLDFHREVDSAEKTEGELSTTTKAGNTLNLFYREHLSVTRLNGLSQFFLFKYHQYKSFLHHQIKMFIVKLNCSSPNSIPFHQIISYFNHQIY